MLRGVWIPASTFLVAVHLLADVVWIGSLLSVGMLVARAPWMADASEVGALARRLYVTLAVPAFLVSLATGAARILMTPQMYAHAPWLHVKLTFALALIVLHHLIGGRARRVAAGKGKAGSGTGWIAALVFLCAAGAVLLGVTKSLP
jgi:putative membrane protein